MSTLDTSTWPSPPAHLSGIVMHYPSVPAAAGHRGLPQRHSTVAQSVDSMYRAQEGVQAYPRSGKPPKMGGGM